jgi:hypothetical protein
MAEGERFEAPTPPIIQIIELLNTSQFQQLRSEADFVTSSKPAVTCSIRLHPGKVSGKTVDSYSGYQ